MHMTIGEALDKIESMRSIVRSIESGGSVDHCSYEISVFLDEYITILTNTKVNI